MKYYFEEQGGSERLQEHDLRFIVNAHHWPTEGEG
jgi:hypothetical protein